MSKEGVSKLGAKFESLLVKKWRLEYGIKGISGDDEIGFTARSSWVKPSLTLIGRRNRGQGLNEAA
ncbi:MAG: hypothetical protein KME13_22810 [Myxacorys californica WJT36-NPBG1]|jgi:hypothetical protein|nr:hypothetical protein [Myxacorys californica WJT36-NPBG1]